MTFWICVAIGIVALLAVAWTMDRRRHRGFGKDPTPGAPMSEQNHEATLQGQVHRMYGHGPDGPN